MAAGRISGGIVFSILLSGIASAADMPVKAVQKAFQATAWEGFYVGGHVGYGFGVSSLGQSASSASVVQGGFSSDLSSSRGITGGVLAGYNHMLSRRWLVGLEGDLSWSDIQFRAVTQAAMFGVDSTTRFEARMSYAARARLGFLLSPETLLFASAGWVRTKYRYTLESPQDSISDSASQWINGWQVGAGVETNLPGAWGVRLEYLHAFYDRSTIDSPTWGPIQLKDSSGIGRIALIHRFGQPAGSTPWDSPEVAPSWTGFYAGGAIGSGAGSTKVETVAPAGASLNGVGVMGVLPSGLFGFNVRVAERVVAGVEAEIAPGISTTDLKLEPTYAVRGRLGYLATPATLVYASAGWVTTGIKTSPVIADTAIIPSQRVNALQVGGGIETAITDHWLARFAYQYATARELDNIVVNFNGTPVTFRAYPQWHYGEVAVVYLFGGP